MIKRFPENGDKCYIIYQGNDTYHDKHRGMQTKTAHNVWEPKVFLEKKMNRESRVGWGREEKQ
jgi:hypothetical protein